MTTTLLRGGVSCSNDRAVPWRERERPAGVAHAPCSEFDFVPGRPCWVAGGAAINPPTGDRARGMSLSGARRCGGYGLAAISPERARSGSIELRRE